MNSLKNPLQILIAGGGIGGLSAGIACADKGHLVRLYERSTRVSEAGAGIQLGPNATRVLADWGVLPAIKASAVQPTHLRIRDTQSGRQLGQLALGERAAQRYGAPYLTVHRADLHRALYAHLAQKTNVFLHEGREVVTLCDDPSEGVTVGFTDDQMVQGDVMIGADGLWSQTRALTLDDGSPAATGHVAYRALIPTAALPEPLQAPVVTVWLGPHVHVVQYPVRGGDAMNVVLIASGEPLADSTGWSNAVDSKRVMRAVGTACSPLGELLEAVERTTQGWMAWQLFDRPPVTDASALCRGRIVLMGDAAHPMRPYLAQGAGMAIEDAQVLAQVLTNDPAMVGHALVRYAALRQERVARVQRKAIENGEIFHVTGLKRWGRDIAMQLLSSRLLDQPWLYGERLVSHAAQ